MKYYLIAGEASGDLHGANLMKGLLKADPQARFRFWGGDKMAAVGGAENLAMHYKKASFMGFVEIAKNLRTILGQIAACKEDVAAYRPDVLILIDYAGFNLRMAKFAKENGIPTYYYIAPKAWAWKESRVEKIRKYVDRLFVIFPFETAWFRRHGIEAIYEGNPLMDAIAERRQNLQPYARFIEENGLDDRPIVALLAGSRRSEIKFNLPFMVELSAEFSQYQFVVAGVSWLDREVYAPYLAGSDVRYVCDKTYELLAVSDAAGRDVRYGDARNGFARRSGDGVLPPRPADDADRQNVPENEVRVAGKPRARPRVRARTVAVPDEYAECDGRTAGDPARRGEARPDDIRLRRAGSADRRQRSLRPCRGANGRTA